MEPNAQLLRKAAIRTATEQDMAAVADIYGHYVQTSTCTFEIDPPDVEEMTRRYRKVMAMGAPYLVAQVESRVVGYAYAGAYRERAAYRHTLENSIYVAPDCHGQGLGGRLMQEVIRAATGGNFLQMVAVIGDRANTASVRLHERLGFVPVGVLADVGYKHGRWLDTVLMQRTLC